MTPQLVGLNDYLNDINYSNVKSCLLQFNEATDKCIDINNIYLSNGKKSSNDEIKNTLNIWGNILNVKDDECESKVTCSDEYEVIKKYQIDIRSPYYAQLKAGGLFTDKYGNRIAIISSDNQVAQTLLSRGYYGKENEQIIITYDENDYGDDSRYSGAGWKGRYINFLTFWDEGGKKLVSKLEKVGINQKKLDKIVIVKLGRWTGVSLNEIVNYITVIANIVVSIIPGIGTVLSSAITAATNYASQYVKDPNKAIETSDLINIGQSLLPRMATGDNDLSKYFNKGINLYQAINNKDYKVISEQLAIPETIAKFNINNKNLENLISTNKVNDLLELSANNFKTLNFNETNSLLQITRNSKLPTQMLEVTTNKQSGYLEKLYDKGLKGSNEWQSLLVNYVGGGYTSALPTMTAAGDDGIINIMNIDNSWKNSPEIHKAYLNMAMSLPTGTSAFDELLLLNIEEQVRINPQKQIVLPAQIPAEKAQCIASELSTNGYRVITSEYQAIVRSVGAERKDLNKPVAISNPNFEKSLYRSEWR